MSWVATATVVATVGSSYLSSNAQKKAADKQAAGIKDAQGMSEQRYQQIRQDALGLFDSAMASTYTGMQEGRNLILSGQASTQDILNQAYSGASQTLQTYGQQAINAALGISGQPPTVQNIQQAEQQLPPDQQTQQVGPPPSQQAGPPSQTGLPQMNVQPGGAVMPGNQQGFSFTGQDTGAPAIADTGFAQETGLPQMNVQPDGTVRPGITPGLDKRFTMDELAAQQANDPTNVNLPPELLPQGPALEGEFIPASYNLPQTGLTLPEGQYGLAGAEQSLVGAEERARQDLMMGTTTGLQGLGRELGFAGEEVRRGRDFGLDTMRGAIATGRGDISSAARTGAQSVMSGANRGAQTALSGADRGVSFLNPYMQSGSSVQERMLALSGTSGGDAFNAAIMNDPELAYNLERGETALGRQAALTGNIGSGSVMAEINRNARMEEAASTQRSFDRLFGISEAGRGAASTAGGYTTQAGQAAGGMQAQGGQFAGGMQAQSGRDLSNISMQGAGAMSGIGERSSAQIADLARTMGITEFQAMQLVGQNMGQMRMQTGQQIGDYRFNTGLNLQNTLSQQGGAQANLQTGLGGNLANINQQTALNLANQAQNYGGAQAGMQTGLANLLTNAGTGQSAQQVQLAQNLGSAQAAGVTNPLGNAISTATGLYVSNPDAFSFGQSPPPATMNLDYSQTPIPPLTSPYG